MAAVKDLMECSDICALAKERGIVVGAGDSARLEAELSAERARQLRDQLTEAEDRARNFAKGGAAEELVGRALGELSAYDIHTLNDRRWPGTRNANIDHVVVGTSGVYVVDTKDWTEPVTITATDLMRGQASCEEELDKVRRMADAVIEEVADEGLAAAQVRPVLAFHGQTIGPHNVNGVWVVGAEQLALFILRQGKFLTQMQVEVLLGRLMVACPPAALDEASALPIQSVSPHSETQGALLSRDELEDAALSAALKGTLDDWMTFLHPTQARLVHRALNGASRISGPAGTGKTVVALHRLAYLAERRRGRLLYVTYVNSVPRVLRNVYARLSPQTAARVEFTTLHGWASRFLRSRGMTFQLDRKGIEAAYRAAWARAGADTPLATVANTSYWREEAQRVIRGRGIDDLDAYLTLDRVGRGTRLGSQQRRMVWGLAEAYQEELTERGLIDWDELLRQARDECAHRPPAPAYDVVVLDEAQDMTLVAMQLVGSLAGEKPDGLLIVGDDQQRLYPGGYRLAEAGIDVSGRSTRLTMNYRNTREIVAAARELIYGEDDDLLEGIRRPDAVDPVRSGAQPVYLHADGPRHDAALLDRAREVLGYRLAPSDGVAVLVEHHHQAARVRSILDRHEIPHADLAAWDGVATSSVIVGTNKSAKGLEFKHVLVPYVDPKLTEPEPPQDDFEAEHWRLRRRELYVAMTRARDTLWVGSVSPD